MAARLLPLAVALGVARGSTDAEVLTRIAELRQQLTKDGNRLEALRRDRRLNPNIPPSIFGYTDTMNSTRPYTSLENHKGALNHMWLILCGTLVMFMQAGFAMVEAGCCRVKNVQSILLKNLTDVGVGTLGWWIFGWSFAYSGPMQGKYKKNGFAGSQQFMGHHFLRAYEDGQQEPTTAIVNWYFQWAFCATAATIVSGGIAERVNFPGYTIFSFIMTSFIYPIVVAWTWGYGFLADMNMPGYMDFAGSGVVHLTGGIAALVGAAVAGPRRGRFENQDMMARIKTIPDKFCPHSQPLIVFGTFILWFGWYGFNCGSTLAMDSIELGFKAAQVAMNTTIAAATGGLFVFFIRYAMLKKYDIGAMCNGILAGLVAITAGCSNVECGTAFGIGLVGAFVFQAASTTLKICQVDDPIDAFAVHGACGAWGVFAAALFDWGKGFENVHGWSGFRCANPNCQNDGTGKFGGNLVGANIAEILVIIIWSGVWSFVVFTALRMAGFLRTADDIQEPGIDKSKHSPIKGYDINDPLEDGAPLHSI